MMVRLWGSKSREESEISNSALGNNSPGNIAVVIDGDKLDVNLVSLACQIAKGAKRKVILIHIIVVPRSLPLKAVLARETERADILLASALHIAEQVGCAAVAEVVQARNAGSAIVDEAGDHHCSLLLIRCERQGSGQNCDLGTVIPYVQAKARCRVWFVIDPPPAQH